MAGRPSVKRTVRSYDREIEGLQRLRMSIVVHDSSQTAIETIAAIDNLVDKLVLLRRGSVAATG